MSLVNDMLRDLDQRRKDNSKESAAARLTPAPEAFRESNSRLPLYLTAALAIVAVGLGLAWFFLLNNDSQQQLDIRPDISPALVNQENISIPQQPVESAPQINTPEPESEAEPLVEVVTETDAPSVAPVQEPERQLVINENVAPANSPAVEPQNVQEQEIAQSTPAPTEEVVEEDLLVAEAPMPDVTVPIGEQGGAVAEGIRTEVARTPEQQDTASVQEALGLIAADRMDEAFTVLEGEIENNRYAHQSRETYAKLLMSQGNVQAAVNLVDAGLQLAPNHPGFKKVKARLLLNASDVNGAVELLIRRAPEVAADSEYHDILASSQLANRDYQGASVSYTSLVQYDQTQGKWWYGFAAAQDRLGNTRAARQAYARAMQQPNLSANLRRRSQERLIQLGP